MNKHSDKADKQKRAESYRRLARLLRESAEFADGVTRSCELAEARKLEADAARLEAEVVNG